MPWEIHWPKVKRRRSIPVIPLTTIPNPHPKYISQSNNFQLLPSVEEHPSLRRPSSQIIRKPLPSSSNPREVRQINTHIPQFTNMAPARILFQTDSYIISSLPGKDPQDVLARIRQEGIPAYNHNNPNGCQHHRRPHENANPRLSPVLSASADSHEIEDLDLGLPPIRTTTPLGFAQFEFNGKDSSNISMIPWIQTHPNTPIGGHEAAPMKNASSKVVDEKGRYEKRYATPRISFPEDHHHNNNKKTRKEARSSSTYSPPNYSILVDGNISRSQSLKADGNQYCCSLGQHEPLVPPSLGPESCYAPECKAKTTPVHPDTPRESCSAQECVAKPTPGGASPSQIEKWVSEMDYRNYMATRIPSIDGAQTPPNAPLTSISDPPITSIHHSQTPPTAPLPIPVDTTSVNPEPRETVTSKVKDTLRNKRGQKSRQGLRKFRKLIFRKGVLKVVLGRQLAQPTADLLDMMAKGIEFDPPDMKALAKPPVDLPTGPVPL